MNFKESVEYIHSNYGEKILRAFEKILLNRVGKVEKISQKCVRRIENIFCA